MTVRVRFAPSPTGHLHIGNARTALFNWLFARNQEGIFILRIEDTDLDRSEERFEDLIFRDLRWLGMNWDEGPDCGGEFGPYRQSERTEIYREKALQLIDSGRAYYCFCMESELERQADEARAAGLTWKYRGTCRSIPRKSAEDRVRNGESSVIRLEVRPGPIRFNDQVHGSMEFDSSVVSDLILIRSNGLPTYNYAVVVDDASMKITHVIRGDDHLSNTPKQVLIYEALGWELPSFAHLSTILGSDHSRLSKRHGAASVHNFREMGILPEALINYIALLGWSPQEGEGEIQSTDQITRTFELGRVSKSSAVFDTQKLFWINRHYMKESSLGRLLSLAIPFLRDAGWVDEIDGPIQAWIEGLVDAALPRIDHLSQIVEMADLLLDFGLKRWEDTLGIQEKLKASGAGDVVRALCQEVKDPSRDIAGDWKQIVAAVKKRTGQKGKELFHPIRIALTGSDSGPELDKLVPLLEDGSRLPLRRKVKSCRERICEVAQILS